MSAESWWPHERERIGFSAKCCTRFGFGFDSGYVANWTPPQEPAGRKTKAAYASTEEAITVQQKRRGTGRGQNTAHARRAIANGKRLVG